MIPTIQIVFKEHKDTVKALSIPNARPHPMTTLGVMLSVPINLRLTGGYLKVSEKAIFPIETIQAFDLSVL